MEKIEKTHSVKTERLVKRSWWKIVFVISIIFLLLAGLSVGLYFIIVDGSSKYKEEAKEMDFTTNISDIQEDILDKEGKEIAIFFYTEDDAISNYMFLDQKGDSEEGIGALTSYTNTHTSEGDRYWYAVEVKPDNSIAEELLLNEDQDAFCDEFESLANKESANADLPMYIDVAKDTELTSNINIGLSKADEYQFSLEFYEDDKDNPVDIMLSIDGGEKAPFVIQSGTTMWFNSDGSIETILKSWGDVPTEDTMSDTSWYGEWIDILSEEKE